MNRRMRSAFWLLLISVGFVVLFSYFYILPLLLLFSGIGAFSVVLGLRSFLDSPSKSLLEPAWCPKCYDPKSLRVTFENTKELRVEKKCRNCGYVLYLDYQGVVVYEKEFEKPKE